MTKSDLAPSRFSTNWGSHDLIEGLPAAVYVCNAQAVVVSYNRRAAELWGREPVPGDTDQKYCGAHRLYRPDGTFLAHRDTPMEEVLRTGKPVSDREVIIERPDGSRITVLVNIAPLIDEGGKLVGAVNCFQDLGAQKQAEQERARLTEELHQAKKMDALGQLMAGVTHDFNNLLTAVLGNLEVLENQITDKGALALLENAVRAARRGDLLNRQLLAFARKHPLVLQAVALNRMLTRMGDLLRTTVGETIRLELRPGQDIWPVVGDPNQIELVVLNLAINARDAMPFGGALTIETRNATFGASDRPEDLSAGDYAVLSLSDTGTGMTEEVRTRAFEPFFTTKGPDKGSGLGLSMALGVAKQSGGGMRIVSSPGEGTSIEIYLARADGQTAPEQVVKSPSVPAAEIGGETVLVVDDDSDVREATVAMLALSGYRTIEAHSGTAALAILAGKAPVDLMMIDVVMPGLNGIETARRARERRPGLPVLYSSGYGDIARLGGGNIDPDHIVGKPYRRHQLSGKVRRCLKGARDP